MAIVERKIVVLLGNGFDLDLNLKTSYDDFMKSDFFKTAYKNSIATHLKYSVISFLEERFVNSNKCWIDVENELLEYANKDFALPNIFSGNELHDHVKESFKILKESMCGFFTQLDNSLIKKDSMAIALLHLIQDKRNVTVLTFNYTEITDLPIYKERGFVPEVIHVHGRSCDKSIVLGYNNNKTRNNFDFMKKQSQKNYYPKKYALYLQDADEIIIFGHSMGRIDHHYFMDLFQQQANINTAHKELIIRIFVKNEEGIENIVHQIDEMTDNRFENVRDNCDLQIYCTSDGIENDKIANYFNEFSVRNVETVFTLPKLGK